MSKPKKDWELSLDDFIKFVEAEQDKNWKEKERFEKENPELVAELNAEYDDMLENI